ncbi:hypothetical protein BIFLH12_00597 [Bifidobacterium longum subsp. longum]|nr:hypothetical protein BIFLH12_00597 [Bifidobacterium longum subsp. longum]
MPITSPGNDDDTGENHQPTLRKNTAEPVEQTLKQNTLDARATSRLLHRAAPATRSWLTPLRRMIMICFQFTAIIGLLSIRRPAIGPLH